MRYSRHRQMTLAFVAGAIALLLPCQPMATIFHVSPQGSDTPPYNTYLSAAHRIIDAVRLATGPGDTILVHTGTYDVDSTLYIARGVTWLGDGRDSVTVNWTDRNYGTTQLARLLGQNEVAGMDLRYPFGTANTDAYGLWAHTYPAADTVNIHHCRFELFKPAISGNTHAYIHSNEFYHGSAEGVQASSQFAQVYDNLFSGWRGDGLGFGMQVSGAGTVIIEHNIFDNTRLLDGGISDGRPDATIYVNGASQVTFRNNVIRQSRRPFIWYYADGVLENNTLVDTGDPFSPSPVDEAVFYQKYNQPLVIRNNVFEKSARLRFGLACDDCDSTGWITLSYNTFWPPMDSFFVLHPGDPPERVKVFDSMNVNAYPMLTPDTLFRLQANSPLIDGGDPTVLDADGSRSDIGWTGGPNGCNYPYLNIPPLPPESLWVSGQDGVIEISWTARHEADLAEYRLYRGMSPGFWSPGLTPERVMAPTDTVAAETLLTTGETRYYVVTAADAEGLESGPSVEGNYLVTGIFDDPADPIPRSPHTVSVFPNPFNSATVIEVTFAEGVALPATVRVEVIDILGRQVMTTNQVADRPGVISVEWNATDDSGRDLASGIYFVRVFLNNGLIHQIVPIVLMK